MTIGAYFSRILLVENAFIYTDSLEFEVIYQYYHPIFTKNLSYFKPGVRSEGLLPNLVYRSSKIIG